MIPAARRSLRRPPGPAMRSPVRSMTALDTVRAREEKAPVALPSAGGAPASGGRGYLWLWLAAAGASLMIASGIAFASRARRG